MKQTKRILSVALCLVMVLCAVPVMEAGATQSRSDNFYSAEYNSDPGQYMVNIAEAQLGRTGSSLGYTEEWCADFVSDCAKVAGQAAAIPANGLVSTLANNIWNAGGTTVSAQNAKPGDICIIDWADTDGYYNHVEIVYKVEGSSVYTIGGNTGVSNANLYTRKVARHSPISSSNIYRIIRPNYINPEPTYTQPPTAPVVTVDKKVNLINEQVTIRFHSERASNYWVGVYKDNVLWSDDTVYGNSYTVRYEYVGKYDVAVVARNNCGSAEGYASFKYGKAGDYKPSNFTASSDKQIAFRDEAVKLSFSANDADSYWIGVYTADGYLYTQDVVASNAYTVKCPWMGNYSIAIVAMNDCTSSDTKYIKLTVVEKKEFSVTYNANGGSGAPSAQTKTYGNDLVLRSQTPTRTGYAFVKWNTKADGTGTSYNPSATYKENADLTLYAIWQQNHTHSYTSAVTTPATCTADGVRTYTCSCGASYTEKINKLGHSYGAWTKLNDTQHQRVCSRDSSHVEKANHSWNAGIATKAATCSTTGVKTYTCSVCSGTKTEPIPVNSNNHVNTTNVAATASTCTVKGYTAGVYCNDCKKYISGHQEQPLVAHKTELRNQKNADCTTAGYTGDQYCTVCKQTISTGTTIGKKAHSLTTINQKDANCTEKGYTGDQYCTVCKQTISKGSATNALGHTSPDGNGNCTRCGTHIKDVTPTQPTQPSQPQTNPNACKWCGQVHTGFFGKIVGFFHSILAIFKC